MTFYTFDIIIEKDPETNTYFAHSPTLPGCFSDGLTVDETRSNMRQAVQLHLETLLDLGEEIPQDRSVVHVEQLTIGVPDVAHATNHAA